MKLSLTFAPVLLGLAMAAPGAKEERQAAGRILESEFLALSRGICSGESRCLRGSCARLVRCDDRTPRTCAVEISAIFCVPRS